MMTTSKDTRKPGILPTEYKVWAMRSRGVTAGPGVVAETCRQRQSKTSLGSQYNHVKTELVLVIISCHDLSMLIDTVAMSIERRAD